MRQRRTDVAEMNFPDLLGAEIADHLLRILAGERLAAFEPSSAAEADSDVRTIRDLHRPLIPVEVPEDAARHAREHRHGRIVRMNADPTACFLRYGGHLLDE